MNNFYHEFFFFFISHSNFYLFPLKLGRKFFFMFWVKLKLVKNWGKKRKHPRVRWNFPSFLRALFYINPQFFYATLAVVVCELPELRLLCVKYAKTNRSIKMCNKYFLFFHEHEEGKRRTKESTVMAYNQSHLLKFV